MADPTTSTPTRETVRRALIELLNTGEHPGVATPATLAAIADTRRDLATLHGPGDPAGRDAPEGDRHAALSSALDDISKALLTTRHHHRQTDDPWRLRAGLTVLTAVALAWLDALLTPDPHYDGPVAGHEDPDSDDAFTSDAFGDESPF